MFVRKFVHFGWNFTFNKPFLRIIGETKESNQISVAFLYQRIIAQFVVLLLEFLLFQNIYSKKYFSEIHWIILE